MSELLSLPDQIVAVQARIDAACRRAGRSSDEVTLIAVSKTHPLSVVEEALTCGLRHFGENRIEEAAPKMAAAAQAQLSPAPQWHMIGHVQSRKAEAVLTAGFTLVQSLDSVKLAERYNRLATGAADRLRVLLEVNISGEAAKQGFNAYQWAQNGAIRAGLWGEIKAILALPQLEVCGLMTLAPYEAQPEATRPVFAALRALREALAADFPSTNWEHLSMGMSNDFEVAIEEGATLIRLGRVIFGERS